MTGRVAGRRPPAWRLLGGVAALFLVVLLVAAAGYGYHRDELYFRLIGGHPAFGYVDQPPLVPLLDHAVDAVSGHSLVWLRVPAALAGALVVLVTGLLAAEFGAEPAAQGLAAACAGVAAIVVSAAHLATTTVFDLLAWAVLSWLVVRALRDDGPTWSFVGIAAGVSLQIKTLPVFLLFALAVGVLVAGPRRVFASRWLWAGAAIALALWAPNLVWQATHGWPQLRLSSSIAAGDSGSSEPRIAFVPFQLVLVSPLLVPVWVTGLVRLWRDPRLATWRALAVAYPLLAVVFLAVGGKPYYLCGLYPVLLAAGCEPTLRWARRARSRGALLVAAVALSAAVSAVLMLPVVPVGTLPSTPVVAVNYDAGETVGWPRLAATVAGVLDAQPGRPVVLAANYGEAGALARYRPRVPVYSGHNSLWDLGPPPADTTAAVVVGYRAATLRGWFASCRRAATVDDGVDLDNDEQDGPVFVCTGPRDGWTGLWPRLRRLG
ncbi:Dolichyl-phosphate-mannose-protein mannosyltransferase [Jatrophihabitans endophyticus]|uniref:Dolichyl-phosphate-mannose-protein mannosyltransferase n=1 Tax=Jatrophihabitans endophyticus TaxID=1206085 RepID=A0A1M5LR79_9ACTN|nr:glycosyltransferase family 39 protein [Jatrophihabitans endophyticus]SHG67410.1 Dolichyl-phosphate-mannose-protein mannosyltransferase [Jatrophihabitans endophyticus]